ncbi:ssDNA binding protein [Arthrobacter phage Uzumaki]|nr:ssDNA binding protein [Arthrobacter phage Uzumaki]
MSTVAKAKPRLQNVTLRDVRIVFRNFSGAEGQYNREGDRNFGVLLDHETAAAMADLGWNVKMLRPREEGDEPQPWIPVKLKFKSHGRPPRVVMLTHKGKTQLTEDMVSLLDWADIKKVDLILSPYSWDIRGNQGVTAYVQSIYVTIQEDELEMQYSDVPDTAMSALESKATPWTAGELEDMGELGDGQLALEPGF